MGCCFSSSSTAVEDGPGDGKDDSTGKKKPAPAKAGVAVPKDVIAKKVAQAEKTKLLALRECGLKALPPAVAQITELRTIDLSVNALQQLPDATPAWSSVKVLQCPQNSLASLPASIGEMRSLEKLVLSQNQLKALPVELSKLGSLKTLSLDSNKLGPQLGDVFAGAIADSLEELDLSSNNLQDLAPSMARLKALTRLIMSRNTLQQLPDWMGELVKLTDLDASDNKLKTVPPSLLQSTTVSHLWLKGNPVDPLVLREVPGFEDFCERRKERIDKKVDA
eukprot:CAMPEP_0178392666 /NCGR_PEP_ID=MMETSP0689_2-20121128/11794_1 /TAXON_ID=160604 /ORGANISM="Amphidinium massartii, Strain CS-259" /LENGTH=278 /DNA_ID=CAMNT_0020013243 /DNA_START=1 /DNA_END=833 /DNA_ORIENTATION=-